MMTDSDGVEMAAFQIGDGAAGIGGAAAEKPLLFVHNGGGVGVHLWLTAPGDQSLVGRAVQGGADLIRWASSWDKAKRKQKTERFGNKLLKKIRKLLTANVVDILNLK